MTDNDLLESIERIQGFKLDDGLSYTVVDCDLALSDMIDTLAIADIVTHTPE
jgi:hypothetical protein